MRLNGRANKKQLTANAKSVKARSASMNFWQTQYRANDKISRAQYKALTRIDRVRKWRMKKLKQPFNPGLASAHAAAGLASAARSWPTGTWPAYAAASESACTWAAYAWPAGTTAGLA